MLLQKLKLSSKQKHITSQKWPNCLTGHATAERYCYDREQDQTTRHSSLTSEPLISSICPSARMRRLADSVTILPFLYQVMVGGGTALDSHSRVTDFPTSTFTTTGESPLLSRILGGTERPRRGENIYNQAKVRRSVYSTHSVDADSPKTVR